MRTVNQSNDFIELLLPPSMLIDTQFKDKPTSAQQLHALDEVVFQHGPVRLILQQVAEPLDLGPRLAGLLLDQI